MIKLPCQTPSRWDWSTSSNRTSMWIKLDFIC
jgi:hypothetical protein